MRARVSCDRLMCVYASVMLHTCSGSTHTAYTTASASTVQLSFRSAASCCSRDWWAAWSSWLRCFWAELESLLTLQVASWQSSVKRTGRQK